MDGQNGGKNNWEVVSEGSRLFELEDNRCSHEMEKEQR